MTALDGISAVIITKNEERNIGRCLDSLNEIADEIIVVDSFSTDKTVSICESKGVRVVQKKWMGYAETKNFGITLAIHPFILSVDADEALSDELRGNIIKLKMEGFRLDAYRLNRLTNYCGKWIYHCGWYPDQKLRLWKKECGQWQGLIHEEVYLKSDCVLGFVEGNLLHFSYYSINEHIQQMMAFTDLMALDLYNKGKKVSLLKLVCSPGVKFLKSYILNGGFRDGFYGFVICSLSSCATFLKYAKAYQLFYKN
jgi:glycosyltransferase involved in cell wall biosynthesis